MAICPEGGLVCRGRVSNPMDAFVVVWRAASTSSTELVSGPYSGTACLVPPRGEIEVLVA